MTKTVLKELNKGFVHLFYPSLCEGCRKPLVENEEVLCISCSLQLPETAYHNVPDNETAMRFAGRIPFMYATSFGWFTNDGLLQHLVHGLKYKGKKDNGRYLGSLLGKRLREANVQPGVDMIIPVPLHKSKRAKRGYNQSMLIAEGISAALGVPASDDLLTRVRDTESQTAKTRAERVENMTEAFRLKEGAQLAGKHILLCDDVLTTGGTLEACALALMKEESVKISLVTIGIAIS
jgi:ComF family protein